MNNSIADQPNQQKDQTKRQTLEHTLDLIGEFGVEGVTTKRISDRMNMSTGILHHHFGTKDNIIYQAYVYFVEDIRQQMHQLRQQGLEPSKKLLAYGLMHFDQLHSSPVGSSIWLSFWYRSGDDPRVSRLLRVYHMRFISNIIATFYKIHPDRQWARDAAHTYFALIQGCWVAVMVTKMVTDKKEVLTLLTRELERIITNSPEEMNHEPA